MTFWELVLRLLFWAIMRVLDALGRANRAGRPDGRTIQMTFLEMVTRVLFWAIVHVQGAMSHGNRARGLDGRTIQQLEVGSGQGSDRGGTLSVPAACCSIREELSAENKLMADKPFMGERVWSDLPGDVIHFIFRELPDLLDFVRSRAVCKAWYSAASLSDLPVYFPWLLRCQCCWVGGSILGDQLCYYSFSSKRTDKIDIKNSTSLRSFRGPSRGYVLLHELGRLALLNPLTKETISLPSLDTSMTWPIWTGVDSNLIRDQNIVVLNRCLNDWNEIGNWSFYNKESRKWITEYGIFNSCCYFQGRLYCIDNELMSYTAVYDVSTRKRMYILSPDEEEFWCSEIYLVESAGVLLRVSLRSEDRNVEDVTILIYKLDFAEKDGEPHWVRITGIGDQLLFLDYVNGFSMSSARFTELRGNCIYFIYSKACLDHGRCPYMYDIELGTVEKLECPFECCSWFVPCLG